MKKNFSIIISCLLVVVLEVTFALPGAMAAPGDCPDGIAGYWQLDETSAGLYADAVGVNDGTCIGSECPSLQNPGTIGNGQLFGGADTITVNADAAFNWTAAQSFTIELWMGRDSTPAINTMEVLIGRDDPAGLSWYLGVDQNGFARAVLKDSGGSGPAAPLVVSKDLRSNNDTWHHVALVHSPTTNILYVDGELTASQAFTYTAGFSSDTAPLTMGSLNGSSPFNGALDEVAVYSRALSAGEIMSHYYISRGYCSRYDGPVQIMPMGDSITKGVGVVPAAGNEALMVGYRSDLWHLLMTGNPSDYYWIEFIGSQSAGSTTDPAFDPFHAGFGGITDAELLTLLQTGVAPAPTGQVTPGAYLNTFNTTEMILLHIGTNGPSANANVVDQILDQIDTFSKNITVLVARIIHQAPDTDPDKSTIEGFNVDLEDLVNTRKTQGDKLILVNMESGAGLVYQQDQSPLYGDSGDMYDQYHPNPSGYSLMADLWDINLVGILPLADKALSAPSFTSTPVTSAVKGRAYSYTLAASGFPSPKFSLVSGPAGMAVKAITGYVTWTPDTVINQTVSFRATNKDLNGNDQHVTQGFTIAVIENAVPVAVADSYSDIGKGSTYAVPAAGVLSNDSDGNDPPSSLTAVLESTVSHGSLALNADGSFTYTHDGSDNLSDTFTYRTSDGQDTSAPASVNLTITSASPSGGAGGGGGGGGCFIDSTVRGIFSANGI